MTTKWAPIVYGRTYETDFRFIAIPEGFKALDWVWDHVLVTARSATYLRDHPKHICWSLFKNQDYFVVGVTCMAKQISDDKTEDIGSRPLYLFAGYVTQSLTPLLPSYTKFCLNSEQKRECFQPLTLQPFKDLYEYVRNKWEEKPFEDSSKKPLEVPYTVIDQLNSSDAISSTIILDPNTPNRVFWPAAINLKAESYKENLLLMEEIWVAAVNSQNPISVCFGLVNHNDALNSPFLYGTALDISEKIEIPHTKVRISDKIEVDDKAPLTSRNLDSVSQTNNTSISDEFSIESALLIGVFALGSAAIGSKLFGFLGFFGGGAVGTIVGMSLAAQKSKKSETFDKHEFYRGRNRQKRTQDDYHSRQYSRTQPNVRRNIHKSRSGDQIEELNEEKSKWRL